MPQASARYQAKECWLEKTIVRRGCAIGAGAILCPGIELGASSVIAAGAVVTRDVLPFSLVRGRPARAVGDVCVCGQPLAGDWRTAKCEKCGSTGYDRETLVHQANM